MPRFAPASRRGLASGEFQIVAGQKHDTGRQFTTAETDPAPKRKSCAGCSRGRVRPQPIMSIQDAVKHTGNYRASQLQRSAPPPKRFLTSRDTVQGLQGIRRRRAKRQS